MSEVARREERQETRDTAWDVHVDVSQIPSPNLNRKIKMRG
jgi:hypothetical protein